MLDAVEGTLRRAGWFPGRSQDISASLVSLKSRGYDTGELVEQFLREFTGITVHFIRNGRPDLIWFDAERAATLADPEWVACYGHRTKQTLVPIGFSNHEHLLLMQSKSGGFYGAFDEFLRTLGAGADEMIETLLDQDREPLV